MGSKQNILLLLIVTLIITSCSNTRYLKEGEYLYTGSTVKVKSSVKMAKSKRKDLESELKDIIRPKPNAKFLGLRIKLYAYNIAGTPKGKGLRYWLKNKVGEPPVLASASAFEKNRAIMQNRLENRGYFKDTVTLDTTLRNKKARANYTALIDSQYTVRNVKYPADSAPLSKAIARVLKRPRIKAGDPYDLDKIKEERTRIDTRLKQRGFFYFNEDYIVIDVDSTIGNHQVDMEFKIKPLTPTKAKQVYRINEIYVYPDYDLSNDTSKSNEVKYKDYTIIDPKKLFHPQIFDRTLVFKKGDIYNRTNHNLSLNRLTTLGVFKFVKARFERVDSGKGNLLNTYYYLTPTDRRSIRFQVSGLTKSNNATGGEASINYLDRNFLHGAELFTVSLFGGLEQQIAGQLNTSIKRGGIDFNLYLPRIISPFKFKTNSAYVPKTKINLGYELYSRTDQYSLNSFKASFGYVFKESLEKEHQLNIISINFVNPSNITPEFQQQLDTNITLARSIERQFIIGSTYNFNLNTQAKQNRKRHNFYFNGNIDLSGNILGLATGADIDKGKQKSILGTPFSQYIRLEADVRHYLRLGKFSSIASRITGGVGFAYGNSITMPFVKQFFAGGTNDIRAFRARSLGPGTYYAGNAREVGFLPDQPGDVKLEVNTEYRAKLFSIVRWALFADAGNVWLRNDELQKPGSKFSKNFLNEFGVGIGTGLRFDVSILILRLDVAFPIRKPYLPEGERWVLDKVAFGDSQWRRDNLVLNLAIGYPF